MLWRCFLCHAAYLLLIEGETWLGMISMNGARWVHLARGGNIKKQKQQEGIDKSRGARDSDLSLQSGHSDIVVRAREIYY